MPRRWKEFLLAIVLGNALYYALYPVLPAFLRHQPFTLDWGLSLDLLLCVTVYLLLSRLVFKRPS